MVRPFDFAVSDDPRVQAQLDRLGALSVPQGRIGLETIRALLDCLGNPQHDLPPVFHVAGTNGKGSTCAFLRAALEAAGKTVHVFTSPHLVRFNERIRVAGQLISDEMLADLLGEVLDAAEVGGIGASFFEVSTAAAFLAFARTPADACVIEVGLGGRFDATNVIETPAVCGIATLGIDHEAFLLSPDADTPAEPHNRIAFEKAGIAKPGAPLVTLDYTQGMNETIAAQAAKAGASVIRQALDWSITPTRDGLLYRDGKGSLRLPHPRLAGEHQAINAGLAIAMLRHQDTVDVPDAALVAAMEWARWPARLQRLGDGPLTALLPPGTPCWLDGGHNPDAGKALARHFNERRPYVHLVIGMLKNKDPDALIGPLAGRLASVTVVPVPAHDCHDASAFQRVFAPEATAASDVTEALRRLKPVGDEIVLIAGSLYLAGTVLRENGEIPD
ncbi:bifunctional folylpolyglutamate synthase/dihydrofolate synthase [Novosphingobium mangrovi (ex Huang et al. 2023)]|uniref:Dihydrofolate synthase/folylpolyglutamate synthase n=1 Tax=Novosphingobium mangrovi (ex Huang et al. 2023) TaxID=2976432 RepID=A0ABT2I755_9SPHN|nr:folylpolyglutamate synthase/dihydrofolate synthase family protein [Novosphingobium mangrovi (ex Huang et al. 2023)]MCT2400644.1 bifunctional folylpolyglutamate synthase/dihydrofolate synthase [Novosphingobium mangrovi (ex Huang et al. 2023)]